MACGLSAPLLWGTQGKGRVRIRMQQLHPRVYFLITGCPTNVSKGQSEFCPIDERIVNMNKVKIHILIPKQKIKMVALQRKGFQYPFASLLEK